MVDFVYFCCERVKCSCLCFKGATAEPSRHTYLNIRANEKDVYENYNFHATPEPAYDNL